MYSISFICLFWKLWNLALQNPSRNFKVFGPYFKIVQRRFGRFGAVFALKFLEVS